MPSLFISLVRNKSYAGILSAIEPGKTICDYLLLDFNALVYDAPILRYLVNEELKGKVEILPKTFERQDYAIALPTGSSLREPINHSLLEKIRREEWQETLYKYLGR